MFARSSQKQATKNWKLPHRFSSVVFSFYMAGIMAFLMCLVITGVNQGIGDDYFAQVLHSYKLAMPSAFVFLQLVRPLVVALVKRTVTSETDQ